MTEVKPGQRSEQCTPSCELYPERKLTCFWTGVKRPEKRVWCANLKNRKIGQLSQDKAREIVGKK